MEPRDLVVVGGSAGGLDTLIRLVGGLSSDLPCAVLVTLHVGQYSRLPQILSRSGPLEANHPTNGERLQAGRIYVAPPGFHLLMRDGGVELSDGPRVNRHRPAVDAMFASAARWAADRVVAVVLSGLLDDGAVGAALVDQAGGTVVVQDPAEAPFPSMPRAALKAVPTATVAGTAQLGELVSKMISEPSERPESKGRVMAEIHMDESSDPHFLAPKETHLTRMVCPDCDGVLAEVVLPQITYYRCHVGHEYGPQSLAAAQAESAEAKLWKAVAALEENAAFARHLASHGTDGQDADLTAEHRRAAERAASLAQSIRSRLQPPESNLSDRAMGE